MKMTAHEIAVAANYLRPMTTPTRIFILTDDVAHAADRLAEEFPDAVHVGFGGRVSHGRLADALSDEFITADEAQTIIAEFYGDMSPRLQQDFFRSVFTDDRGVEHPHPNTVVIMIHDRQATIGLPRPLSNQCVGVEFKEAVVA